MADQTQMDQGPAVPRRRRKKKQNVAKRTSAKRRKIYARLLTRRPMNIWAAQKGYGMMHAVASAVFKAKASNTSARTRRKRSLPRLGSA
jgi:hypothetical protein